MAEKDVQDVDEVAASLNSMNLNNGGTELKILQKINDLYQKRINEVERVEGDLEEPSEQVLALKLENKILREWNQKSQETIQQLCSEMTETESLLGEKYEQMLKNMEKVPKMIEIEQEKLLREINELKTRPSEEIIGDSQLVTLKRKLEEVTEERDSLKKETQKLSKVINSIQEGDSLVNSRTQRLEQENMDLKARIAELESHSKRSSLSLLDKIDFNSSDELEILPVQTESSTTLIPETSENDDKWSYFLKKVENSLKINPEEFQTTDSVDTLLEIIDSRTGDGVKSSSPSSIDAEIQVDVPQQLQTVVQTITETANNVISLLETIESHKTDLPIEEIRTLLTDFDKLLASVKSSAETKIKTKFTKTGNVEITGFVDIPEAKFTEFVEKFQTHEKSVNAKITEKNKTDMHAFRRGLASLVPQIEHLRDQIQDKNYYQKENKALLKKIETLEKKIVSLQGTISKTFNSLASSDMLEEKKRNELQAAFKMNDMIGLTLAIQSIGVGMRNELFAAGMETEKSREEVRRMKEKLDEMEQKQNELKENPVVTEKETKEMEKMMGMQKIAEEESRQMKKYIASVRLELIHLLTETRNQHSASDGTDSSITSDYDTVSLAGLMNDLKREIIMKDEVLKSRQVTVDNLEMCLAEMKRHLDRIEKENHTLTKTNSEISKQLSIVEKEKQEIAEKKEEFDKLVTDNQQELASLKQAKEQLEFEHANQTQTIQHLRRVLEETKRNGNATIAHSKDMNNILNLNIRTLSAQMNELYAENMEKDRQIQLLRDGNLELREQITELNKDILEYSELLELKNLGSKFAFHKENERDFIKQQTNQLNEEIRKLREAVNTVCCVENEKKKLEEKHGSSMGEYEDTASKDITNLPKRPSKTTNEQDAIDQIKQILVLSQDMAQANFDSKRYEELKDGMSALQTRLKEFADRNNQLCAMLTEYESKYKDFETQIGKLSHENNDLQHHIDDVTDHVTQLKRENAKLSELNIKVTTELDVMRKTCKCGVPRSTSARPTTPPNRYLSLQIKDLRKQLTDKTEEIEKLKDQAKRRKIDVERALKQANSDKERYHKECTELVEVVAEYKSRVAILDQNLQRKDSELVNALEIKKLAVIKRQEVEKSASEIEKRHSDLLLHQESLKQQLEELREELAHVRDEHREREGRTMEELQAARQAIRDQQVRITQQEMNFKLILETRKQLEKRAETYLKEIKQLKTKLSDETNTKQALMELSDVLESEQKQLKDKLCRLTNADQDLGKAVTALENLKQHNYDLTIMHTQLQRDYNLLRENHQQLLDLRTQSIKALEASQHVQEEGDAKESCLRSKIEELLGLIAILVKDRDYLKAIVSEKHRDITILSSELSSINLTSQPSTIEYPTKMHQPFFPSQMHEIPAGYTADTPTTVADEPDAEAKLSGLRQLTSSMQQMKEAWINGIQTAIDEAS